jgi:hypothetical protein
MSAVVTELKVLCGPDQLVPDVTVALRSARYQDGDLAVPALLCVEKAWMYSVGDLTEAIDTLSVVLDGTHQN